MFPQKISQNIDILAKIHRNAFPWQPAIMGNKPSLYYSMFQISLPWLHLFFYNACPRYLKSRRDLLYLILRFTPICKDLVRCSWNGKSLFYNEWRQLVELDRFLGPIIPTPPTLAVTSKIYYVGTWFGKSCCNELKFEGISWVYLLIWHHGRFMAQPAIREGSQGPLLIISVSI